MRLFRSIFIPLAVQAIVASLVIGCLLVALTYLGQQRASAEQDRERIAAFATAAAEASRAGRPLNQVVRDAALAQPALNGRLVLFGPDNTRIAGTISGATTSAEASVVVEGRRVATARLVGQPPLAGSERTRLTIQYVGVVGIVLLMLAGLLAAAFSLARRFGGPQLELFRLSREVVHGDHDVVIDDDHDGPTEIVATMRNLRRIASQFSRLETARRTWLVSIADELKRPAENMGEHFITLCEQQPALSPNLLALIEEDARRLIQMSEDLSAVALADLGRLSVTFAPADARTLIQHAIYVHEHRARVHGVQLQIAELPEQPVSVEWDSARIGQLLGALIDNSLRYTPENGRIVLGLESARDAWRLIIDDSAPGVDVMLAQRLFEPFYRSADRAEESAASGLGLATARAIVDAHHGRIEASRSPIGGLRVTVVLPAQPAVG